MEFASRLAEERQVLFRGEREFGAGEEEERAQQIGRESSSSANTTASNQTNMTTTTAAITTTTTKKRQRHRQRHRQKLNLKLALSRAQLLVALLLALGEVLASGQPAPSQPVGDATTQPATQTMTATAAASSANLAAKTKSADETSQQLSAGSASQPSAEALRGDQQQQQAATNVILIKYANVTTSPSQSPADGQEPQQQQQQQQQQHPNLNTFKLFAEPLSVSIIESKFAHSIQLFDVSQNQLSTLSKDLFCPLSNEVRQLNISHNLLENFDCLGLISQNGQLCLSELRVLDMSHNLIKHLPATGVATLHNLEILNLSHNQLESLDELSLSSLFKLTKLDLSNNRLQQLPLRIFQKSTSMQVLRLQSNYLQTTISQILLAGLMSIEELNLSSNNISQVNDFAFLDKVNLTRVDLTHNQLASLRIEVLQVTSVKQASGYRHRLHHNGQYAGVAPKQTHSQSASAEFLLSSNPFICDCQLDWLRKFQPSAIKRTVLSSLPANPRQSDSLLADQLLQLTSSNVYQNDQPPVISTSSSDSTTNNISEIISNQQVDLTQNQQQHGSSASFGQNRPMATLLTSSQQQHHQAHLINHYARIGDLDLVKCTPLFRRNNHRNHPHAHHQHHDSRQAHRPAHGNGHSRALAPPDGAHQNHQAAILARQQQQDSMIDLLSADSSNFLCRYKSHCFALCHCCEFDACDCEMICPSGCNCYYDSTWQTNIIDCSSNNHTVVPDRIPMDVSGLYLDGNNIDSLKPSNLIARKSLKTLYLNSSNLQHIANRTFNGLIELQTLYLHDNLLRTLNGYEFEPLAQLRALYLQSNRLDHISNQTFIYLRSLEILDLSNNRLTATNLDLFWSIGHHNIRLRQLSIAHNWWSCQCSSISRFRQILKQKFLLNGSVNIADKNQLRCYYNSTTVGPLILADGPSSPASLPQPLYASYPASSNQQRQQTQLTEINQCSELIEDRQEVDFNPPLIHVVTEFPSNTPPNEYPNDPDFRQDSSQHQQVQNPFNPSGFDQPIYTPPGLISHSDILGQNSFSGATAGGGTIGAGTSGQRLDSTTMPLTSFILLSMLLGGILIIAVSIFVFVRQQQRFHQSHHKKSSAASTTSASSSVSSTAISSLNGKSQRHNHIHQHTMHAPHNHHHLIMSNGSGGATTTSINHHHINHQSLHHQHSISSQSNIYAALVSPTTGNSTAVSNASNINNPNNNLYSNSSTTTSHHSGSSPGGANMNGGGSSSSATNNNSAYPDHWTAGKHQLVYNQPYGTGRFVGAMESPYPVNANSQASYKTGSLYNAPDNYHDITANADSSDVVGAQSDWIRLPKVKQFMSKLVNKSLALGGYRSCSRDELSAISSDKIYDAFISYDKRDEAFVMQHLSAELEYGQPQYRVADRFRDLPLPSSAYIAEAITSVVGCSHRTIIVLTENYLTSSWCRYELQAALHEASMDKSHKIIAVILDPKCLLEMDGEMRALLTNSSQVSVYQQQQQQQQQLVQLDGASSLEQQQLQQAQLVATLTNEAGGNQQISTQATQLATSKIAFINYNERKFWPKLKQLMPLPRPSTQTLTLTTKN